jgi:hypothetical protein
MSKQVDRFISEHKEYFSRNKMFILSNDWDDLSTYNNKIDELFNSISNIPKNIKNTDLEKRKKEINSEIRSLGESHQKNKLALFKQETDLTSSIVSRLSTFIKDTEKSGERKLSKVQNFIDYTADIIQIHIDKCNKYLNYSKFEIGSKNNTEEQVEYRGQEIKFQDGVFQKKIGIQDILSNLNIQDSFDDINIKFHDNDLAPLVMRELLCPLNEDINEKTKALNVIWDFSSSTELFINMKEKDIPKWNNKKHYFDQDPVVVQFWAEELHKIKYGVTIGGYYIHGWLYFHLNFFRTPIPQHNGTEPNIQPDLRDNEYFFCENLKSCTSKDYPEFYSKAMLIYGTRRFGKSVILASLAHWKTITKFNSIGTIVGGNSSDLSALTSKIKTSMLYIDKPMRMDIIKQNWENGETTFGIKEDASNALVFSTLMVQNLDSATTKKTQKTAGLAPSVSIYDEIGKYPFLKPYLAALPSFKTPYGFKCVTVLAGTGGEADLSKDAMDVLSNPQAFDLLPMDWDLLESHIDPEFISWTRSTFSTFFPGQMAYEEGFIKEKIPLSKYLNNEALSDITIAVTNWKDNKKYLEDKVEEAKKAKSSKANLLAQQRKVQYPLDPKDCFISTEKNPFPYMEAIKRKEYLLQSGEWDRRRILFKGETGRLETQISDMPLIEYPHKGGTVDAPALVFEEFPLTPPPENLYVASFDDVKQDDSDTNSLISFQIWKMETFNDEWAGRLVFSWTLRPENRRPMYEKWLLLQQTFNARAFPENEDMGYKSFLETKHLDERWLISAVDFTTTMKINSNNKRKYGWTPRQSKRVLLGLLKDRLEDPTKSSAFDQEDGDIMGIQTMNDIGFLEEIINYKEDVNVDRISAALGAVGWMHYLEINWMLPKQVRQQTEQEKEYKFVRTAIRVSTRNRRF